MSRRYALIACLLIVIGVFACPTPCSARVIHCGSVSLEVPDTWKAYDGRGGYDVHSDTPDGDVGVTDEHRGSWEACEDGESRGYLTTGVLNRSSLITPLGAARSRRELESHLRDLPRVEAVRVREFDTLEIDGVPAYRARYTLATKEHDPVEQSLYIVGGRETSFLAFTRAASSSPEEDASKFDEIVRRARVHSRPVLLGLSREWSIAILAAVAASSLLFHAARAVRARRARVPVTVEAPERRLGGRGSSS